MELFEKIKQIKYRDHIPALLKEEGLNGWVAEIGVCEGGYHRRIYECDPKMQIAIDPWYQDGIQSRNKSDQGKLDGRYHMVYKEFGFNENCRVIRDYSFNAHKLFDDQTFDFIYIDGDHTYEAVRDDIELWWPKLKVGGIFAGHDYRKYTAKHGDEYGVIEAVDEHIAVHKLKLHLTREKLWKTWITVKEK